MAESWVDVKAEVSSEEIPPPVKASSGSDESIEVTDKLTITWVRPSRASDMSLTMKRSDNRPHL